MQNIVINFDAKNEEILNTIELLEKIGEVEKGTAQEFKKAAAERKSAHDVATKAANEQATATAKASKGLADLQTNAKELVKTIGGGALTKGVENLNKETDKAVTKQTSLRQQLRAMKQELATLDEGSSRFNKLSIDAARLEDKLGDVSQRVRNLASDTAGIDALISGAQGVTGAFAVAQGSIGLFGGNSEELQKTLLKVNSAMAIMTGLQQVQKVLLDESAAKSYLAARGQAFYATVVGTSTGAMKAFRIALAATGIGLIVIALAALVTNFDKVKQKVVETFPALNGFGKVWDIVRQKMFGFLAGFFEGMKVVGEILYDVITGNVSELIRDASEAGTRVAAAYGQAQTKEQERQNQKRYEAELPGLIAHEKRKIAIIEAYGQDSYNMKLSMMRKELELLKTQSDGSDKAQQEILDKENEIQVLRIQRAVEYTEKAKQAAKVRAQFSIDMMQDSLEKELAAQALAFSQKAEELRKAGIKENEIAELNEKERTAINARYEEQRFNQFLSALQARIANEKAVASQLSQNEREDSEGRIKYYQDVADAKILTTRAAAVGSVALQRNSALQEMQIQKEMYEAQLADADILESAKTQIKQQYAELNIKIAETEHQQKVELEEALKQSISQAFAALQSINQTYLDWELNELKTQLDRKQISQEEYEKKVIEAKRKQAIIDKNLSMFNIFLNTAQSVIKFLADPGGAAGVALSIGAGITGAAQLAAVASRPIPGFRKGTKSAPAGWKWVGEDGPELIHTPGDDIILPYEKSINFAKAYIDAPKFSDLPNILAPQFISSNTLQIDYKKLARTLANELKQPKINININNEYGTLKYNSKRYVGI